MKSLLLVFFNIYFAFVNGNKLKPYEAIKCHKKIGYVPAIQTVILDFDENFNASLKTCMIKNAIEINSVVLINNKYTIPYAALEKCKTDDHPNIVIITKQVTSALLNTPSVREVLRSQRSVLTIAVTDEEHFTCKNDSMNSNDFIYLEKFMNELWHEYKIAHVSMSFPLSCYGKIAVYGNKKSTNKRVYDRTIMLVRTDDNEKLQEVFGQKRTMLTEGYPLKANIFERIPTSTRFHCDKLHYYNNKINLNITDGYCGLDAFVMHTIVEHFKFELELVKDNYCDGYGYNSGTNLSGSLGCISRKELDISFNSRFMTMYSSDEVYFLHFVTVDSLCVMIKQADVIPIWLYGVIIYTPKLWLIILSLHVFIGFFWWITSTMNKNQKRTTRKPLVLFVKDAFTTVMFGFTQNYSESRLVKGICLFTSIMFLALYQGHINHIYTTLVRYKNINKLSELFKSDIVLHITPSIIEIMKQIYNKENEDERNFIKRMVSIPKFPSLDLLLNQPNIALVGRQKDMHIEIFNNYTTGENKQPLINIMNECLRTYYLSYIGRSGFPFVEELQRLMMRVREAGLDEIYYRWTCGMYRVPSNLPKIGSEPRLFNSITLEQVQVAFGFLSLGQLISLFIFIVEVWKAGGNRRGQN